MQALRSRSHPDTVTISSQYDSKSRHYVVLWKDIQRHFKGAQSIMDGTEVVMFLKDINLEE